MRKVSSILIVVVLLWGSLSGSAFADFKDGLVGYWPFDETSGQVAHSLVPASADGQLYNFPGDDSQWVPGQIGGALHFRGPQGPDYVIAPSYPTFTGSLSFSGWVFADVNTVVWQSIFKNWAGPSGQFHFGLRNVGSHPQRLAVSVGQANTFSSGSAIDYTDPIFPTGQWVHVGFTVDPTLHGQIAYIKLYRNGQLVGIRPFDGTLRQDDTRGGKTSIGIGVKPSTDGTGADGGAPGYWQGSFDDFGLWNRVLSDDEMAQIYTLGMNGKSFYNP